ncbi:MAG: extracellular solute-binding protein [Deltaproteobacteria bacterium]|nr:extracellular solute-binding protein [Deltaproteobacteria bacterium]MBW2663899.1 extracellular solute-binding protein [Deltaproteobacteria bacterium]
MNKLSWIVLIIISSSLCFILTYFYITGDDNKPKPEIVVNATPTTSSVTWYTSIPQRHADRIANAFKIETGIDVKIVRNSTFIIRERLMSEIENGATEADVVTIADIGTFLELKNQGHLMKYASPHYKSYPEEYKDTGYWAVFAGFGMCMAYNESRIDTLPQHWTDLLNERWKGRIGLEDINTAGSQYGQYYMLREKLGVEFWEKLLSVQEPKIYYRTEELANALLEGEINIAGEFSIHTVYNYRIKKGTSIKGIYPEEGIPLILNPVAIINQTDHEQEAKIFFDFLISQRGQELMQRLTYKYSIRQGMAPLDGIPPFDNLNILQPENATEYAKKKSEYIQEVNSFLEGKK